MQTLEKVALWAFAHRPVYKPHWRPSPQAVRCPRSICPSSVRAGPNQAGAAELEELTFLPTPLPELPQTALQPTFVGTRPRTGLFET